MVLTQNRQNLIFVTTQKNGRIIFDHHLHGNSDGILLGIFCKVFHRNFMENFTKLLDLFEIPRIDHMEILLGFFLPNFPTS